VPAATITDEALYARIIASPADPRLAQGTSAAARRRSRGPRTGIRRVVLVAAAIVFCTAGGAVGAVELSVFAARQS
jgi:hypothetical protein